MTFERRSPHVHVAFFKRPNRYGVQIDHAVRAKKEPEGWRIDRCAWVGTWTPWEAIDRVEYPTLRAAKQAIRDFVTKEPTP
jgi:hypothetical protein